MSDSVTVWDMWDIKTVLDVKGFAAADYLVGKPDEEVRTAQGDKLPNTFFTLMQIGVHSSRGGTASGGSDTSRT